MASYVTIKPRNIDISGDYVVNSISSSGNVTAGNIKSDHLLYANGTPYVFTTNAAGTNTQVQFNDGNSFAGSANLTFNKTTGTLTANFFVGDGSQLTGLPASYTDTDANSAIDARVTKSFIDNLGVNANTLNGHSDTYFATSTQGNLADTALQPADLTGYATETYVTDAIANIPSTDLSSYATQTYVNTQISNLVDSAPTTLNTLNELAAALGDDANFASTIANSIGNKLSTSDFTSTADTWLGTKSTSDVSEGTNLYFTDTRANTAIGNRVTKTFVDNLSVVANIANVAYSVDSSNIVGQVANSLVAGTVYANAQPNITSIGALTSLSVTGSLSLGSIANLYIPGGSNNYIIKTDGAGNLSWTAQTASGNASIGGSNTQIFFNDAGDTTLGSSTNLTFNKTTNTLTTTNFVASGTTNLGEVGNITVTGGSANNYLKTDGSGTLSWGELPTTSVTLDSFTGNGVQVDFTLSSTPASKNYTIVVVSGVFQLKGTYSLIGSTLTFSEAPPNGSSIEVTTINSGVSVPSGGGSGSGFSYQGISANTTLTANTKYIVNTSASNITLTLPSSATLGDEISIIDGTGTVSSHALTVYANGGNIMGNTGNLVITTNRAAFTLVYYNATQGWIMAQV